MASVTTATTDPVLLGTYSIASLDYSSSAALTLQNQVLATMNNLNDLLAQYNAATTKAQRQKIQVKIDAMTKTRDSQLSKLHTHLKNWSASVTDANKRSILLQKLKKTHGKKPHDPMNVETGGAPTQPGVPAAAAAAAEGFTQAAAVSPVATDNLNNTLTTYQQMQQLRSTYDANWQQLTGASGRAAYPQTAALAQFQSTQTVNAILAALVTAGVVYVALL